MAQFFGLIPLNADNFESGSATEGQVLSADGSGGASWETVEAGGGGGSFVFDGAVILLGDKVVDDGEVFYPVTLTLTLGGVPINTPAYAFLSLAEDEGGTGVVSERLCIYGYDGVEEVVVTPASQQYNASYVLSYTYNGQPDEPNITVVLNGGSLTARLRVLLPNGGVVVSGVMDFIASS